MLSAALLAAALSTAPQATLPPKTAIAQCFATMDGAVYHGDPTDRRLMRANVQTCRRGIAEIDSMRATTVAQGPQKLYITGRVLDRAATLSYMGLGDSATALREVRRANLYFRIASGLRDQDADYHQAALANAELTRIQLQTLRADLALAAARRAREHRIAGTHVGRRIVTAYHKL